MEGRGPGPAPEEVGGGGGGGWRNEDLIERRICGLMADEMCLLSL